MQRLMVFSRVPEPGRCKTRLIPVLGPGGAAQLHRQLIEATLEVARRWRSAAGGEVEAWFTGGAASAMAEQFGHGCEYRDQPGGDLGRRLAHAFDGAFTDGAAAAIAIGADCPDLTPGLLKRAFETLADTDAVIGPACDGGYYLLGLRRTVPELFRDIAWGTGAVCGQTLAIAGRLGLAVHKLPMLRDIDRPEDLVRVGRSYAPATDEAWGANSETSAPTP